MTPFTPLSLLKSLPLASSSRLLSTSTSSISSSPSSTPPAHTKKISKNNPKRLATTYGIPLSVPKEDWPIESKTNTDDHPLWKFFGVKKESLEVPDKREDTSSRSWTAPELRQRDFNQLHQLWYILLRERNVLLSSREEARRLRLDLGGFTSQPDRLRMVQKSMARVKQVISERKHAAEEAIVILKSRAASKERAEVLELRNATREENKKQKVVVEEVKSESSI